MLRYALFTGIVAVLSSPAWGQEGPVSFNRDIRPILSNHCFVCHGPDNNLRKAKLRLDVPKAEGKVHGGADVLVAGKPGDSELYRRLTTDDAGERMPPADSHKPLSKAQIALIRQWIEQGAPYEGHWSLLPVQAPAVPAVKGRAWVRNPVDSFVLARLEREGLKPAPEADLRTLLRRLSFDLLGLPPTHEEVEAFVQDRDPQAYEKQVDRLLDSKHFGERMAVHWLDLVRYADTGGYHSDNHRDVYLYRDWVIDAFNRNLPFDRFTIEQLAGDLLPNPTDAQRIASGYNRLLQTTEEGGAQAKEYQAKYQADRVRNFSTVWLGLTLGCTECHDHKYDPFTQREFYQLAAFFADVQERAVGRQEQTPLVQGKALEALNTLEAQIEKLRKDKADKQEIDPLLKRKAELIKGVPTTLITRSGPPRVVRVLARGNWLDDSGEIVQPETPASLPALKRVEAAPEKPATSRKGDSQWATRLELAHWLTAPENPLTARVFVNRLWQLAFGQGLVKTQEDFGAQGAWPTHPELLDWLASDFREHQWDVKRALRQMVTSAAYRQSSVADAKLRSRDPYNVLLARQGRYRLDAEFLRDNALAVSGLLVKRIGGPSVRPYQPAGYLQYLNFPKRDWAADKGEDQYRRGLYTYWQRSFLHPSLLAFDAPSREECTAERVRSNTPQQALVLLNDPTYVEAARVFAEKILRAADDPAGRTQAAFRMLLQRDATPGEASILADLHARHLAYFTAHPKEASLAIHVGQRAPDANLPAAEVAAWTSVTRAMLSLHETVTRN